MSNVWTGTQRVRTSREERWLVPLTRVNLPERGVEAAAAVMRGGWLSSGPEVEAFEDAFAARSGCAHGVACTSGTSAIELAYALAGVGAGDEVITPSLTFSGAANAAWRAGARPVFVDIVSDDDLTVDPDAVARAVTPRTRAVVPMHYGGYPCRAEVAQVAAERGIALIEDAAHAPGAVGGPGPCGSWGAAGCFSFYSNKNIPIGEGGMLVTNDAAAAERARRLRGNGITRSAWDRRRGVGGHDYDVPEPGASMRMDESRAALGRVLLDELDDDHAQRADALDRYREQLDGVAGLSVPFAERPAGERPAYHLMVVLLANGLDRRAVVAEMNRRRIETSLHFPPIHRLSAYADPSVSLPRTESVAPRLLTLPLFRGITSAEIDAVCGALRAALAPARAA